MTSALPKTRYSQQYKLFSHFILRIHIFYFQQHAFSPEILNKIESSGMPSHCLRLKVGMPIMLTRNLNPTQGHCNGTRYIVKSLSQRVIVAEISIGPYKGNNKMHVKHPLLNSCNDCHYNFRERTDDTKDQVHTNRPHFTNRDGT